MSYNPMKTRASDFPMLQRRPPGSIGLVLVIGALAGCGDATAEEEPDELLESARTMFEMLESLPEDSLNAPEVLLGRSLFWDERISFDGRTACASCHTTEAWGSDARSPSIDARGEPTSRQSQTVFNSTMQPALRWLGDRDDAASQAHGSLTGSMGFSDPGDVIPLLREHGYEEAFREAFSQEPRPVSPENYARALEAYQSTLITPAPFDAYLAGQDGTLTAEQEEGLELFISTGCVSCHSGTLLGGEGFQRFGVVEDYWAATGSESIDSGRYAITGEDGDRYVFRIPMLRNISRTGPYFHDGSVETLREAVDIMARVQLGRELGGEDLDRLVAFLESLSGDVPPNYSRPED